MGACVSSHHKSCAMKVHVSSGSDRKPDNHVAIIPHSPIKEKLPIIHGNLPVKPQLPPLQSTDESLHFGIVFPSLPYVVCFIKSGGTVFKFCPNWLLCSSVRFSVYKYVMSLWVLSLCDSA
ncbi:hypothetical protein HanPI659440_Chr14g0561931 [Helianthus annuus]|nr:hypothetical protein HanPI659440_Chr14g0561931 [Helianthus annuus]